MKLAFIANARIPSERANAVQTGQMCAAFAAAGAEVTLYYPDRRNSFSRRSIVSTDYEHVVNKAPPFVHFAHTGIVSIL